jgi:hypothetical protein
VGFVRRAVTLIVCIAIAGAIGYGGQALGWWQFTDWPRLYLLLAICLFVGASWALGAYSEPE